MQYVALVTVAALIEFLVFGFLVGRARARFGVPAPATSGHEVFDRYFRVQMNTLEQLVVFLPALWLFAHLVSPLWAAGLGVVFLIGRIIYLRSYVRDPKSRSLGFLLTVLPSFIMLIGVAFIALRELAQGAA